MKKYFIGLVSGMTLMLLIGVGATLLYKASDIEFSSTNVNWEVNNVSDAMDDLFNKFENAKVKEITLGGHWYDRNKSGTDTYVVNGYKNYAVSVYCNNADPMRSLSYTRDGNTIRVNYATTSTASSSYVVNIYVIDYEE